MTEYINREAAIAALAYRLAINKDDYERAERKAVDWLPEAEEDVVKVVRCNDCRYWDNYNDVMVCMLSGGMKSTGDYCSFGERVDT